MLCFCISVVKVKQNHIKYTVLSVKPKIYVVEKKTFIPMPLDKHDNSYRTENSELFDLSFICNRNHWFVINFLTSGCLQQQQKQKRVSHLSCF